MRAALSGLVALTCLAAPAAGAATIALDSPEPGETLSAGFTLDRPTDVEIDATLVLDPDRRGWMERLFDLDDDAEDASPFLTHAMLVDAGSRRTLWRVGADDGRRESGSLVSAGATLALAPGRYELVLVAMTRERRGGGLYIGAGPDVGDSRVALRVPGAPPTRFEPDGRPADALVVLGPARNGRLERAGFELAAETTLRVRTIYEGAGDVPADYGWIADAAGGEVVWMPRRSAAVHAGGATKNRLLDDTVTLPAGRYEVAFGTDDSHAADGFNAAPPDDPLGWGLALLPGPGFDRGAWSVFDPTPPAEAPVGWTRVGDDAALRQAFRLARDGAVRIDASGEWGGRSSFVDGAWLVDAGSDEVVWRMTERNTIGAGGAAKNRRFVGEVALEAGVYELHYVTDGSHAFGDWNAALPFEPEAWGVTLRPGRGLDEDDVVPLADDRLAAAAGVLARLAAVGSDRRERAVFRLDAPTRVEIVAVGEGDGGEMYDYGGVDDGAGRTVWRMEFDETVRAGGAAKNRRAHVELELGPGEYVAWFVTDGSHAAGDWNAAPPDDPHRWGIAVRRAD